MSSPIGDGCQWEEEKGQILLSSHFLWTKIILSPDHQHFSFTDNWHRSVKPMQTESHWSVTPQERSGLQHTRADERGVTISRLATLLMTRARYSILPFFHRSTSRWSKFLIGSDLPVLLVMLLFLTIKEMPPMSSLQWHIMCVLLYLHILWSKLF